MLRASEKLKEVRLQKRLTLEDISKNTKIKAEFLEFIENGEYEKLPSVSYAKGFVKNYAKFLGLSEKEIMAIFRREFNEEKTFRVLPGGFEKTEEFELSGFKIRQTAILIFVIFTFFIGYILFQYRYAFINPPLEINSPKNSALIYSSAVKVSGKTDPNSTVYINSDAVSVDQNGNFEKTISVFSGKTTITVKAINKFLKETEKKIEVNVKPSS